MTLSRIIKLGCVGDDVKWLQNRLSQLGFYNSQITGNFGPKTELSLKSFQKDKGVTDDGCVGMMTFQFLNDDVAPKPVTSDIQDIKPVETETRKSNGLITIDKLKNTLLSLGYNYDDNLNIIGVRSSMDLPDVFNDYLFLIYNENGEMKMNTYIITTDPGVYWLNNPMNVKGTAVLKPGQYKESHSSGFHQGKKDHRALVQTGLVTVYRDGNKDKFAEESAVTETAMLGINIHGSNKNSKSSVVGKWSAGCSVHQDWNKKEEFMDIVDKYKDIFDNKFTYTLLKESQLLL